MADSSVDSPQSRSVTPTLVTYLALAFALTVPMLIMFVPYAVSVATGAILAVLCYPLYSRIRRRLPPWAAGLIMTSGVVLLVLTPIIVLSVGAVNQGAVALAQISTGDTPTFDEAIEAVRRWLPATDAFGTPAEIRLMLKEGIGSLSQSASQVLLEAAQGIPNTVLQLMLVVLSTYFLLVDGRNLFHWVAGKVPLSRQIRTMLVHSFRNAATAVVMASVAAAGVQAAILLIGYWALGVPAALLAGGVSFIFAWVPTFGTVPVWSMAAIYLYVQDSPVKAAIMVGIGLFVGVVDNIVRPLVLRGREEMHPFVGLLAVFGGLVLFGPSGVFLGPLMVSMAIAVLDIWPAVASFCGIAVSESGDEVPVVPMPRTP